MDEYVALIAEARALYNGWSREARFINRLADALEAAPADRAEDDRALSEKVWDEAIEAKYQQTVTGKPNPLPNPYRITEENN